MARFPLDLSKFKKVAADDKVATLQHPHGHTIHIAMSALDPKTKKQLESIPMVKQAAKPVVKMAEGGDVAATKDEPNASTMPEQKPDDLSDLPQMTPGEQLVDDKMDYLKTLQPGTYVDNPNKLKDDAQNQVLGEQMQSKSTADIKAAADAQSYQDKVKQVQAYNQNAAKFGLPPKEMPAQPMAPGQENRAPAEAQQQQMQVPPQQDTTPQPGAATQAAAADQGPDLMGGYNQQIAGIDAEAAAKGKLGQDQTKVYEQRAKDTQDALNDYNQGYQKLLVERDNFIKDVNANRINPEKYWENHSKLAAGLGIILAGFNPTHSPNAALDFVNSQIDRSIQAQAKNLDSAHNLLAANMHQFGNLKDATAMARVMMSDVAANKLDALIAKAQDPMAKARALQMKGQLQQQAFGQMQSVAINQALIWASQQQQPQSGGSPTSSAEQMLPYLRALKPEAAKELESRLVPGVGMATIPVPQDSRDKIIAKQQLGQMARDFYSWAEKNSGALDPAVVNTGATKAAELQSLYRNSINGGVFKKGEQEFIDNIVDSNPTKFFNNIRVLPKLKEIIQSNDSQLNTLKKGFGLPSGPSQQSTPEIKTMNGIKYMRGPNGKAIPVK